MPIPSPPGRGGRRHCVRAVLATLLLLAAGCAKQADSPPAVGQAASAMVASSPADQIVVAYERGIPAQVRDRAGAAWEANVVSFFDAASRRDCALVLLEKPENQRERHERVICREGGGWQFARALKQRQGGPVF